LAQVIYSAEALADLDRIIEFLLEASPAVAGSALTQIQSAVTILEAHPRIGRRVDHVRRELVITHGASGRGENRGQSPISLWAILPEIGL
jgi:plasmid stabilization system protein ParE